ncbi:iron chaperone [Naasia lichenicola]|uniref:DUF1801 domain-containing protein n=1 Tax=Naasia lichenicola TaxID=2565933 RepID=A0A4S4FUC6_9MICO|nr:DUF1801 domain-containing protein [Naasia lichenicola]THG33415.1 DUF1801 domain-containing protein [Naasia lichenicola]
MSNEPDTFTDEERAAMKERAKELRRTRSSKGKVDGLTDLREKLAEMPEAERRIGERIHEIVNEVAPELQPKTWYGQPAWTKDGKVIVFFQGASKFSTRYSTLGFQQDARLDEGSMWATSFALTELSVDDEKLIGELIRRAAG